MGTVWLQMKTPDAVRQYTEDLDGTTLSTPPVGKDSIRTSCPKPRQSGFWIPPKIWQGETAFILGGGPTLNQVNFDLIKDRHVIGTNNAYQLGSWVDFCFFGDCRWWDWHRKPLATFAGVTVTCCIRLKDCGSKFLRVMDRGQPLGIDHQPGKIAWGRHTGAAAINFAYHLGAKKIVLLGYDMRRVENKANWHDQHPSGDKNPYARFLKSFPSIRRDADRLKVRIINCTPDSAISVFEKMSLDEFISSDTPLF